MYAVPSSPQQNNSGYDPAASNVYNECVPPPAFTLFGLTFSTAQKWEETESMMCQWLQYLKLHWLRILAFKIACEERLALDTVSQSSPGNLALHLSDGKTVAYVTVANPFAAACFTASCSAGTPAATATFDSTRKMLTGNAYSTRTGSTSMTWLLASCLSPSPQQARGMSASIRQLRKFSDFSTVAFIDILGAAFSLISKQLSMLCGEKTKE